MRVLIVDLVHPVLLERLAKHGIYSDYLPDIKTDEILNKLSVYQGLVLRSKIRLTREILDSNRQLRFIGRVGSGLENIDVSYAQQLGITVINSPEGNRSAVGEYTIGAVISLLHKICRSNEEVKRFVWRREENRGIELEKKIFGIIGYGNMGTAVAKRLHGFDVKVIAYDKYKNGYGDDFVREVGLEDIFEYSDVVSLHVPLTDETRFMADERFFSNFRKPIYFINTSRGKVLKTSALVWAIKTGKVLGAVLDVLEYESFNFSLTDVQQRDFAFLRSCENVILTPHIAGLTYESFYKLSAIMADKIIDFLRML